jgi:hypothetical protein
MSTWALQQINGFGGRSGGNLAVGDPRASVYNGQLQVLYRDAFGVIWHDWYDGPNDQWNANPQQINYGGVTVGPRAAGDPFVSVYDPGSGPQLHVSYRDAAGVLWEAWYSQAGGWGLGKINDGDLTDGPPAAGDPFVSLYGPPEGGVFTLYNVTYRDATGVLWDASYSPEGGWSRQPTCINGAGGVTDGPLAAGDPFVVTVYNPTVGHGFYFGDRHVLYRDAAGVIWDAWYDGAASGWNRSPNKINNGGVTDGPPASHGPCGSPYVYTAAGNQQTQFHVLYGEGAGFGIIWDAWLPGDAWKPEYGTSGPWNLHQINGVSASGVTVGGPPAAGDPFVSVYDSGTGAQLHVLFRFIPGGVFHYGDVVPGIIQHDEYDGSVDQWSYRGQQINGVANGAAGDPFVTVYDPGSGAQFHVLFRDTNGILWHGWFTP